MKTMFKVFALVCAVALFISCNSTPKPSGDMFKDAETYQELLKTDPEKANAFWAACEEHYENLAKQALAGAVTSIGDAYDAVASEYGDACEEVADDVLDAYKEAANEVLDAYGAAADEAMDAYGETASEAYEQAIDKAAEAYEQAVEQAAEEYEKALEGLF